MVLVFDMDDTLYDELTYVRSGFGAVGRMLAPICGVSARRLANEMWAELERNGRGRVFDAVLEQHHRASGALVRRCVHVYRHHTPNIVLWRTAESCLARHRGFPVYIVTDGHKVAQRAKATALGLYGRVKRVLITHEFGRRHAKPSPYCFERIAAWEQVSPNDVVYIADNPHKDFVGIRTLGFRTLRVRTGQYANTVARPGCEAEKLVTSLTEVDFTQ